MRITTGWRENNLSEFVALSLKRNSNNLLNLLLNSTSFKINSQIVAEFFCNLTKNSRLFINFYGFFATLKMTKCRKTQAHKTPKNSQKSVNFLPNFTTFFHQNKGFKLC